METEKMGELYQQIAEGINEIIPSEWEKVILYAEILDDSSEVFFISILLKVRIISILIIFLNIFMLVRTFMTNYYYNYMTHLRNYEMSSKKITRISGRT